MNDIPISLLNNYSNYGPTQKLFQLTRDHCVKSSFWLRSGRFDSIHERNFIFAVSESVIVSLFQFAFLNYMYVPELLNLF